MTAPLAEAAQNAGRTIVFFDGVCGLCNRSVDFLIARDHEHRLLFAPLQGETFAAVTGDRPDLRAIDSIIVLHEKPGTDRREFHVRSRAALFALSRIGPPWTWLQRIASWVPQTLSDAIYRCIAKVRYRIWGRTEACRMPTAEERALFLP